MKTYMKYLGESAPEYKHTRFIHDELDRIALRCEEELVISAAQLSDLNERLDSRFECFTSQRKLLWHAPLLKKSPRRNGETDPRYVILFSDRILVCSEESGRKLEIKRELSMKGLILDVTQSKRTVMIGSNDQQNKSITYHPFRVNAVEKSYEFLVEKEADRDKWVIKIRRASDEFNRRQNSIESKSIQVSREIHRLSVGGF